ncbi:MAG: hypothetical protein K0Q59_346, partial [Paenibacillus sp.]|nr:hypothetical protein [Paenibacillus sp.]
METLDITDPNAVTFNLNNYLTEGSNTFYVRAKDSIGNETSVQINFSLDTVAPALTISPPTVTGNSQVNNVNSTQQAIQASSELGASISLYRDTSNVALETLYVTNLNAVTINLNSYLTEGSNTFYVRSKDSVGNETSVQINYFLDTVKPSTPVLYSTSTIFGIAQSKLFVVKAEADSTVQLIDVGTNSLLAEGTGHG